MKKEHLLVFCTFAALGGTAAAQSSATIYGVLDASYQNLKSGDKSPLAGASLHKLEDGHRYGPGSRLGVLAQEDLGGGLRAEGRIEMGLNVDTGALAQGGRAWGRQAYVALASTTAGEVRLGRQYILHDETMGVTNPFGNTTVLNPGGLSTFGIGSVPMFIDAPRVDNAVQYRSPKFGGFGVQFILAPSEGLVDRYQGVKATYSQGALNAAASYEWSKARTATAGVGVAGDTVNKVLEIGANYNFGSFTLFGGFQRGKDLTTGSGAIITAPAASSGVGTQVTSWAIPGLTGAATELSAFTVGASAPFGATTVAANYTSTKYENAAGSRSLSKFGVVAMYAFSKTTATYAGLAVHGGDLKDFINEKRVIQLGLRKSF